MIVKNSIPKTCRFLLAFVLFHISLLYAQDATLIPDSLVEEIIQQVSGEKAWWHVNHLTQYHRIESSSGYHKAALYVEEKVKEYGLKDIKIETFDKTLVVESLREDLPWPQRGFFRTGLIFKSLDNPSQNTIFVDSPKCFL